MTKEELNQKLKDSYQHFTQSVEALSHDEFEYMPPGKWSAGQHAEHLLKSVKPVEIGDYSYSFKFCHCLLLSV